MLESSGSSSFYAQGLRFSCTRCSACCRHESGYVFLSKEDAARLGAALKMAYKEFVAAYCRWVPGESGEMELSLREKSNFDCVFWTSRKDGGPGETGTEGGCSVYESRPLQCRSFPFWPSALDSKETWKAAASGCPGMNRGTLHSRDSIEEWLALRQKEPAISRGAPRGGVS